MGRAVCPHCQLIQWARLIIEPCESQMGEWGVAVFFCDCQVSSTVVCSSLGTQVQEEKPKSLNKEQTTAPQVHYKPWCGLL